MSKEDENQTEVILVTATNLLWASERTGIPPAEVKEQFLRADKEGVVCTARIRR